MSYLPLPTKNDLQRYPKDVVEDSEKRWGYVPNIVRAYALAPEILQAEDVWSKGVMYKGFLPRRLKEAIATVVSATNKTNYCSISHAHAISLAGGKKEEATACQNMDFASFTEKERAALEFARKATQDPKSIAQSDIDTLRKHYTGGEIVEIAVVIQAFMGYNWFVTMLGLELEKENPLTVKT